MSNIYKHSAETIEKIRQSFTPERRERIRQLNLGKHLTIETKAKMRQASLGKKHSEETKEKIRQANLGKKLSPEHIEKIRQVNTGNTYSLGIKHTPEQIEKIRQAKLGKKHSLEHVEKMRQALLGHKVSIETKKKISQAHLGKKLSKEHREKIQQSHRTTEARERSRQSRLKRTFPSKMTSIEQALCNEFKKRRLKFEMHKTMFGRFQPDFVFEQARLIVQADGDYWHGPEHPEVIERDKHCDELAHEAGYTVFRFTETIIKTDAAKCARTVAKFVRSCLYSSLSSCT